ncbi:hypothetical protein GCM10023172_41380 [Hymenobacter ginsengisoli]|uniref:Carboxypeptidase regulatory-like domain-containing protein n=1 Tax=Hymenobacter ginsengisoli TaxID=1051626 RepID=A0ABP8QTK1_9BACT
MLSAGCAASNRVSLPTFSYNQRFRNRLIVNRIPHYGDGNPDGCIVESQFALALRADGDSIAGIVTDTETKKPVFYAITTLFSANTPAPRSALVSPAGRFAFSRAQQVRRITVAAIGYRTLTVDVQPISN